MVVTFVYTVVTAWSAGRTLTTEAPISGWGISVSQEKLESHPLVLFIGPFATRASCETWLAAFQKTELQVGVAIGLRGSPTSPLIYRGARIGNLHCYEMKDIF